MPTSTLTDIQNLIAPILVIVVGMIVLLMDVGTGAAGRRRLLPLLSIVSLIGAAALGLVSGYPSTTAPAGQQAITSFAGGMVSDRLGAFFTVVMCLAAALAIGMSGRYLEERHLKSGEFYALILFSAAGGMFMALAYDLVNVFVGLEVLSVALYILSGFARRERRSEESAVKYFLLGAFASGFLLYGMALIYGAVGLVVAQQGIPIDGVSYTNLGAIGQALHESALKGTPLGASPIFVTGVALLIVGLGFKAAIVPFHSYAPDVYEGAPTPVTAFMSVGAKVGAFAALMRFAHVLANAGDGAEPFRFVVWTLAVATMLVGNILAVRQTNIKRMLAYSSIAHAGYLLVGVLASGVPKAFEYANQAVVYYLFVYALMNLGAFGLIVWLGRSGSGEYVNISDYAGLARRKPWAAAAMSLFMLSLAGIPPAAGFLGKLYLFMSAVTAGYAELAVIGLVVSAIGVFYYLNIILTMYFREPGQDFADAQPGGAGIVVAVCAGATLLFGVAPIPGVAPLPERPAVTAGMLGNTPAPGSVTPPGLRAPGLEGPRMGAPVQPLAPTAPGGSGGPGSPP